MKHTYSCKIHYVLKKALRKNIVVTQFDMYLCYVPTPSCQEIEISLKINVAAKFTGTLD
jgi:hypothetical protein